MYFCPQIEMPDVFIGIRGMFLKYITVSDESTN